MVAFERQMLIEAHRSEISWMIEGYRRMADALERDINDIRINYDDQFPSAEVKENGKWETVGKLLDLRRLDETLGILRRLESGGEIHPTENR